MMIIKEQLTINTTSRTTDKGSQSRGAVLLVAILVSSVALAVGLGVYSRTYKELLLGSYWKQAQIAFAAADSGLECALYWELNPGTGGVGTASCFGVMIPGWDPKVSVGSFSMSTSGGGCVNVIITGGVSTTTEARGYNTPGAWSSVFSWQSTGWGRGYWVSNPYFSCSNNNPRRVERGLKITY